MKINVNIDTALSDDNVLDLIDETRCAGIGPQAQVASRMAVAQALLGLTQEVRALREEIAAKR
ncbi:MULTISPECIES: hypothetical protein [Rhodococcus]|uniref:hypothetical protein n=1 Tax=Rhodococcus TaxID=1827 RepID=UPI0007AE608B|nr:MULTISPECIES: hypothetical protein [Rhodococcus]KZL31503.1 hypothetical protein A3852_17905 [Rhodococcus qingshengii]MCE4165987.1 hypothetical protein [Rhodococcus sp. Ni2]REK75284.1 hypothetical protein DVG80_34450 [Rhodococcus erythropolis]